MGNLLASAPSCVRLSKEAQAALTAEQGPLFITSAFGGAARLGPPKSIVAPISRQTKATHEPVKLSTKYDPWSSTTRHFGRPL
ncbi:hypothetical protein SPRG_17716 [Saprolegnia parasitica CBS 223.65]|uniref:Uncharacterized protein n=1 Tax=Saprolegnia parasitica (strain CBS 223.65) TaxID=695850 RepID=A0A067BF87_SAPPC|nr:hypothetical protein SPRG_17716 [Saprolegnia parasitica CBS 223.65]KDO16773.1 hypothetical protein SPRG_17716 [Saprolegnia parasitica CBS 223.65]|eukprot:XP_012212519.1 hypothetical protein SPRG_17716 [Saprolegnia parasitica CBS 223.65]